MSGEEVERKLDWIDTPKGQRVPTWESTNEAFKEVENILNELYEKLERVEVEAKTLSQRPPVRDEGVARELRLIREELRRINERLSTLEDAINLIDEKIGMIDYLSYIVEEEMRKKRGED